MIITEKSPKGVMTSDIFDVQVSNGELFEKSDVYLTISPDSKHRHAHLPDELKTEFNGVTDGGPDTTHFSKAYYTAFTSDGEVRVRVKINCEYEKIEVLNKDFNFAENTVEFSMIPGEKAVITLSDDFGGHLAIRCDSPYPIPKTDNIIEFTSGLYTAENCKYITLNNYGAPIFTVPDNSTVYLHRSAVINAAVFLEEKHNVKIIGHGIISTVDRCYGADKEFNVTPNYSPIRKGAVPAIYIKTNSSDIVVDGITLSCEFRGINIRNSENITINNVSIFTGCINSDGINMISTRNVLIKNSMVISDDDCIAMFTSCDSIAFLDDAECKDPVHITSNIEVENCFLATAARAFCVGGHSTGNKSPHDILENLYVHNVRAFRIGSISYSEKHASVWSGPIRILSQTEQYIRNIKFENLKLRQHEIYCGKLIHIEVRSANDASYTETNGYRIENVEISNIEFTANTNILPCLIKSQSDITDNGYCIDGVKLNNIILSGRQLTNSDEFITICGPVKNLVIS